MHVILKKDFHYYVTYRVNITISEKTFVERLTHVTPVSSLVIFIDYLNSIRALKMSKTVMVNRVGVPSTEMNLNLN